MKNHSLASGLVFAGILVAVMVVAFVLIMPTGAHAQTVPSCVQPIIGFVPYIYEGELHSFDYVVPEKVRSLVTPIGITIDGKNIDIRYSTEWTLNGNTRVHVDVPTWEGFSGTFPVVVHVKTNGGISCETQATFTVTLPERVAQEPSPTPEQDFGTGGPVSTTPVETPTVEVEVDESPDSGTVVDDVVTDETPQDEVSTDDETDVKGVSALASLFSPVTPDGGVCKTLPLASWIILALVHIALAGAIIFFLRNLISESNLWFAIALLLPFVGFLALWFVFDGCRMYQWFPVVVALVSLGTVLGVPADDKPSDKKTKGTTGAAPLMKMPNTASKNVESPTLKSKKKEEAIKF